MLEIKSPIRWSSLLNLDAFGALLKALTVSMLRFELVWDTSVAAKVLSRFGAQASPTSHFRLRNKVRCVNFPDRSH